MNITVICTVMIWMPDSYNDLVLKWSDFSNGIRITNKKIVIFKCIRIMNVRYSNLHCNLFLIWSKSSLDWTCWIDWKFSFLSCVKRAWWKLFPRLQKCLVLSWLYGFWKTMTSQLESSWRIQYTRMYEKQLFEQEISQWRLLQLFD